MGTKPQNRPPIVCALSLPCNLFPVKSISQVCWPYHAAIRSSHGAIWDVRRFREMESGHQAHLQFETEGNYLIWRLTYPEKYLQPYIVKMTEKDLSAP